MMNDFSGVFGVRRAPVPTPPTPEGHTAFAVGVEEDGGEAVGAEAAEVRLDELRVRGAGGVLPGHGGRSSG